METEEARTVRTVETETAEMEIVRTAMETVRRKNAGSRITVTDRTAMETVRRESAASTKRTAEPQRRPSAGRNRRFGGNNGAPETAAETVRARRPEITAEEVETVRDSGRPFGERSGRPNGSRPGNNGGRPFAGKDDDSTGDQNRRPGGDRPQGNRPGLWTAIQDVTALVASRSQAAIQERKKIDKTDKDSLRENKFREKTEEEAETDRTRDIIRSPDSRKRSRNRSTNRNRKHRRMR